ncbi:hypothetical protein D3C80_1202830 [compost metagenome]
MAPKKSFPKANSSWFPITNSTPIGVERVSKTDKVCGKISSETKNLLALFFFWSRVLTSKSNAIASAAAVPSSNNEAFAISIPVNSITVV